MFGYRVPAPDRAIATLVGSSILSSAGTELQAARVQGHLSDMELSKSDSSTRSLNMV